MYKEMEKNQNYTWLIRATQNMKNIVTKITKGNKKRLGDGSNCLNLLKNIISNFQLCIFLKNIVKTPDLFLRFSIV